MFPQLVQDVFTKWFENPVTLLPVVALPLLILLVHVGSYIADPYGLRGYPGPLLAKLSHGWLGWLISTNSWSTGVESLHKRYGTFVRLAPDHISVADPSAFATIYGHSSRALKAPFYDAFSNFGARSIFNTRSRVEHARKRRIEAHMFAPQSIRALETTTRVHVQEFVRQWDTLCAFSDKASGGKMEGTLGSSAWKVRSDGRVWFDSLRWFSFWSFDTIGDLALGAPFGMLRSGKDIVKIAKSNKAGMHAIALASANQDISALETEDLPVIETLAARAETITCIAFLPAYWRPIVGRFPHFRRGYQAAPKIAGLSVTAVARRIAVPEAREDMLKRLLEARDENGNSLSPDELSAEAFTLIIAGADTTANASCATTYFLAHDQRVQGKLQAELDAALRSIDDEAIPYDAVKDLPYLDAVINEGLRYHTTVSGGLPRLVPAGGMNILGQHFKEGTWVSVPTYCMHRNEAVWGENAAEFYPERWLEAGAETKARMQQCFAPFSVGPRACIGRSLALMQLHIILATIFRRYHVVLESNAPLEVQDGVGRKPTNSVIGLKRRFT